MTMTTDTTLAARWAPIIDGWDAIDHADPNAGLSWWQDGRFSQIAPHLAPEHIHDFLDPDSAGVVIVFRDGSALSHEGGRWVEHQVHELADLDELAEAMGYADGVDQARDTDLIADEAIERPDEEVVGDAADLLHAMGVPPAMRDNPRVLGEVIGAYADGWRDGFRAARGIA